MNKTSRQKWSIHCCGTGESVAEVLNLLLTFFVVSVWISKNAQKGHQLRSRLWNQDGIAVSLCKWQHYSSKKLFTIWCRDVTDVHEVLEVTVYDDNRDHKYSFLGKVWPRIELNNLQWIEELCFSGCFTSAEYSHWRAVALSKRQESAENGKRARTEDPFERHSCF